MKIKNEKNRSHIYNINLGLATDMNIVNIKCLSMKMLIFIKQHPSNIWYSFHEKVEQYPGWLER